MNELIFTSKATVIGKLVNKWVDKEGNEHVFPILNYQQDSKYIGQLRVTEELFSQVEIGKDYLFNGEYVMGRNGGYIKINSIDNSAKGDICSK